MSLSELDPRYFNQAINGATISAFIGITLLGITLTICLINHKTHRHRFTLLNICTSAIGGTLMFIALTLGVQIESYVHTHSIQEIERIQKSYKKQVMQNPKGDTNLCYTLAHTIV